MTYLNSSNTMNPNLTPNNQPNTQLNTQPNTQPNTQLNTQLNTQPNLDSYMFVDLNHVNHFTKNWMNSTDRNILQQKVNLNLNLRQQELKEDILQSYIGTIFIFLTILAIIFALTWIELKVKYAYEIQIYELMKKNGPLPLSNFNFDMKCILLSLKYHELFKIVNATFLCAFIERQSAWFLLLMLQEYPNMETIHWAGSGAQLNANRLPNYLKNYDGWKRKDNKFRFLFKSPDEFNRSVAVRDAQKNGINGSVLESLFNGGFCKVAVNHASKNKNAKELARDLLARVVVFKRECGAEKHMRRVTKAVETANTTGTVLAGGVALYGAAKGAAGATTVTGALGGAAKGVFTGAAAIKTTMVGSTAAGTAVATQAAATGGVIAKTGAAVTAAKLGATGGIMAKAAAAVTAGCSATLIFFAICFAIAMAIIMAVVAAIVTAIYASEGSGGECTGGDYYIIEEDENGNEITTRVNKPVSVICSEAEEGKYADITKEVTKDLCT